MFTRSHFQSVNQYKPLKEWLDLHDAVWVWTAIPSTNPHGPVIEGWRVGSAIVHVILHADRSYEPGGWDLAATPTTIKIDETFADIEARIGLDPVVR